MRILIPDGFQGNVGDGAGKLQGNVYALLGAHSSKLEVPARRGRFVIYALRLFYTV